MKDQPIDPEDAYWRLHSPLDKDDELFADEHGPIDDDADEFINEEE